METLAPKIIPIIAILILGILLQRSKSIGDQVIQGLKYLILNVSLPAILLIAFSQAPLSWNNSLLFFFVFAYCFVLLFIGRWIGGRMGKEYFGEYFTGFEFGMLGVALLSSFWGADSLATIALVALGHEIFIWFVYAPLLENRRDQHQSLMTTIKSFLSSPIILAIAAGILINSLQLYSLLDENIIGQSILNLCDQLSQLAAPLILIVVGYSLRFTNINWTNTLKDVLLRFGFVLALGYSLLILMQKYIADLDPIFSHVWVIFILLPPPFILPIFMDKKHPELIEVSNTIIVYTIVSLVAILSYVAML